jgi:hypothetical protein
MARLIEMTSLVELTSTHACATSLQGNTVNAVNTSRPPNDFSSAEHKIERYRFYQIISTARVREPRSCWRGSDHYGRGHRSKSHNMNPPLNQQLHAKLTKRNPHLDSQLYVKLPRSSCQDLSHYPTKYSKR